VAVGRLDPHRRAVGGSVETVTTAVYERDALPVGTDIDGPAVIVQVDSTTLVPPGASFTREYGRMFGKPPLRDVADAQQRLDAA
jgi:N-methylhydantoinase A/oxoprolinase/acetone carboxylase beta subunit